MLHSCCNWMLFISYRIQILTSNNIGYLIPHIDKITFPCMYNQNDVSTRAASCNSGISKPYQMVIALWNFVFKKTEKKPRSCRCVFFLSVCLFFHFLSSFVSHLHSSLFHPLSFVLVFPPTPFFLLSLHIFLLPLLLLSFHHLRYHISRNSLRSLQLLNRLHWLLSTSVFCYTKGE